VPKKALKAIADLVRDESLRSIKMILVRIIVVDTPDDPGKERKRIEFRVILIEAVAGTDDALMEALRR
jgi:hypothetical protein